MNLNKVECDNCYQETSKSKLVEFKGNWICRECYSELENCDYCGEKTCEPDKVITEYHTFCDEDCYNEYVEENGDVE